MADDTTATAEPWPAWLAALTPEQRVHAITMAAGLHYEDPSCSEGVGEHVAAVSGDPHCTVPAAYGFLLRLLGEARQEGYESAFTQAMDDHQKRIDRSFGRRKPRRSGRG